MRDGEVRTPPTDKPSQRVTTRLWRHVARAQKLRSYIPLSIKRIGSRWLPESYFRELWASNNPCENEPEVSTYPARHNVTFGILKSFSALHAPIIGACKEMGIPYRLVDFSTGDWLDRVKDCPCDAFLVRPCCFTPAWKQLCDERLHVINKDLGKIIYPSLNEIWLYESKRRTSYWLEAHHIPHARTRVFYSYDQAMDYAGVAELPIVVKTDLGAGASGVHVFRGRSALRRHVRKAMTVGVALRVGDVRERQRGFVLFQEFIPDAREWRIMRIGSSYFGYEKLRKGDFHSGSHQWRHDLPPSDLLDFAAQVTDQGGFTSMALDILVSRDGRPHVGELQTVFGMGHPYEMCVVNGEPGRMIHDPAVGQWKFQAGSFCQNYLWNQRLEHVLSVLECSRK